MFFALDRADRDAIVQAIKDGFAAAGRTTYTSTPRSGSGSPYNRPPTTEGAGDGTTDTGLLSDEIVKLQNQLSNSISSNIGSIKELISGFGEKGFDLIKTFDKLGGQIMNTFYSMEYQAQKVYTTFGMGHSAASAINQALSDSTEEILKMGGELHDSYDRLALIGLETGKNFLSAADATKDILAIERVTNVDARGLVQGFNAAGYSVHQMKGVMEDVVDYTRSVGANVETTSKNVVGNLDKMNLYNFSNGVQGLAKMAAQATMFKMDMRSTFEMSEKLLSPENAIEMAAGLQRLGVATSDLVDPLRLMDLAQNDPEQLQQEVVNLSKEFVKFNQVTGKMEIMPGEQRRLREIAQTLGLSKEELAGMAIQAADLDRKMSMIKFPSLGMTEEDKTLVANMATMKDGKYVVSFKDERGDLVTKAIEDLNMTGEKNDLEMIKAFQENQPKDMLEAAKQQLTTLQDIEANTKAMDAKTFRELAGSDAIQTIAGMQRAASDMMMRGAEKTIEAASTMVGGSKNFGVSVDKLIQTLGETKPEDLQKTVEGVLEKISVTYEDTKGFIEKLTTAGGVEQIKEVLASGLDKAIKEIEELVEEQSKIAGQAPKLYELYEKTLKELMNARIELKPTTKKVDDLLFTTTIPEESAEGLVKFEPLPEDKVVIEDGKVKALGTDPLQEKNSQKDNYQPLLLRHESLIGRQEKMFEGGLSFGKKEENKGSLTTGLNFEPFTSPVFPNVLKEIEEIKKQYGIIESHIKFTSNWGEILKDFESFKKDFGSIKLTAVLDENSFTQLKESNKQLESDQTKKIVYEPDKTKVDDVEKKIESDPLTKNVDAKVTSVNTEKVDEKLSTPKELHTKFVFPETNKDWNEWLSKFGTDLDKIKSSAEVSKLGTVKETFEEMEELMKKIKAPGFEMSEEDKEKYINQLNEIGTKIRFDADISEIEKVKNSISEINEVISSEYNLKLQVPKDNLDNLKADVEKQEFTSHVKLEQPTTENLSNFQRRFLEDNKETLNFPATILPNTKLFDETIQNKLGSEYKFQTIFDPKTELLNNKEKEISESELNKNVNLDISKENIDNTLQNLKNRSLYEIPLGFEINNTTLDDRIKKYEKGLNIETSFDFKSGSFEGKKEEIEKSSLFQPIKFEFDNKDLDEKRLENSKPLEIKTSFSPKTENLDNQILQYEKGFEFETRFKINSTLFDNETKNIFDKPFSKDVDFKINQDHIDLTVDKLNNMSKLNPNLVLGVDSEKVDEKYSLFKKGLDINTNFLPNTNLFDKKEEEIQSRQITSTINYETEIDKENYFEFEKKYLNPKKQSFLLDPEVDNDKYRSSKSLIEGLSEQKEIKFGLNLPDTEFDRLKNQTNQLLGKKVIDYKLNFSNKDEFELLKTDIEKQEFTSHVKLEQPTEENLSDFQKRFLDNNKETLNFPTTILPNTKLFDETIQTKLSSEYKVQTIFDPKTELLNNKEKEISESELTKNVNLDINKEDIDNSLQNLKNRSLYKIPLGFEINNTTLDDRIKKYKEGLNIETSFDLKSETIKEKKEEIEKSSLFQPIKFEFDNKDLDEKRLENSKPLEQRYTSKFDIDTTGVQKKLDEMKMTSLTTNIKPELKSDFSIPKYEPTFNLKYGNTEKGLFDGMNKNEIKPNLFVNENKVVPLENSNIKEPLETMSKYSEPKLFEKNMEHKFDGTVKIQVGIDGNVNPNQAQQIADAISRNPYIASQFNNALKDSTEKQITSYTSYGPMS